MQKTTKIGVIMESKGGKQVAADLDRVGKSTESVGRQQTRLGQASASAGRSFSAQASGLGGLVGVYAAAAANVFAITAAFDALGKAAQSEQIIRGTKLLALEIGQSGSSILKTVQEITQGQLTLAEAAQNVNIALSAGFNTKQIEQLSDVSLKASRALGRNLTDAFQRVVRGAAKLEPELLDELGIFTRIDPAVAAYASKLNIAASSLTNYEKRQAFVNAVIEEGQKKFSAIDTGVESAQKTFEQLRVSLVELGLEFGLIVAKYLAPVAEFFKNNMGNALLLFGGILGLVFGRAVKAIGAFVGNTLEGLGRFSTRLADSAANMESFRQKADALKGSFSAAKAEAGLAGKAFQTRIAGLQPADAQTLRDTLQMQEKGQLRSASAINAANKVYKEQIKFLEKGSDRYKVLNALIQQNNAAIAGAGLRTKLFIGLTNILNISIRGLATAFAFLSGAINTLFIGLAVVQLAGTLFDRDFLGEIRDYFGAVTKAAEDLEKGIKGAVVAASGAKGLEKELRRVGATDKDIENLDDTLSDLISTIDSGVAANKAFVSNLAVMTEDEGSIAVINDMTSAIYDQTQTLGRLGEVNALLRQEQAKGDDADKQKIILLKRLQESYSGYGDALGIIGAVSSELELSTDKVANALKDYITVNQETGQTTLSLIKGFDVTGKSFDNLGKNVQDTIINFVLLENTLDKADQAFKTGVASSETLSKQLGGARSALEDFITTNTDPAFGFLGDPNTKKDLEERIKRLNELVRVLKNLEIQNKALDDQFGKFGKTLDEAVSTGLVSASGVSKDANDIAKAQADFLAQAAGLQGNNVDKIKEAVDAQTAQKELDAEQVLLLQGREKALKAIAGMSLGLTQELEKETKAREKTLMNLQQQLLVLEKQNQLQAAQSALALQREQQSTASAIFAETQQQANLEKSILEQKDSGLQQSFKREQAITAEKNRQAEITRNIALEETRRSNQALKSARELNILREQNRLAAMERTPNLFTSEENRSQREAIIKLEFDNAMRVIEERRNLAQDEAQAQIDTLVARRQAIAAETTENTRRINALLEIQDKEALIRANQQEQDRLKLVQEQSNIVAQKGIIEQQRDLELQRVSTQEAQFALENNLAAQRLAALRAQADVVKAFVESVGPSTFTTAIKSLLESQGQGDLASKIADAALAGVNIDFTNLENLQKQIEGAQQAILTQTRTNIKDKASQDLSLLDEQFEKSERLTELLSSRQDLENQLARLKNQEAVLELSNANKINEARRATINAEIDAVGQKLLTTEEQLNQEAAAVRENHAEKMRGLAFERDVVLQLQNSAAGIVQTGITDAMLSLNDALIDGTFTMADMERGFRNMLKGMLKEIQRAVFTKTIVNPIAEGIGKLFSFSAAGGVVHMAGGGSMKRDRVPTMLEPGEFVIRKEAAKKIGMSNLAKMNSGIRPDPVAMLIARLQGEKVSYKAGGGHPGLSDSSAAGTRGMAGGSLGRGRQDGPGSAGFGSEARGGLSSFGGGGNGGNSWGSPQGQEVAAKINALANQSLYRSDPYYSAAQDYLSRGYGSGDSAQSAIALSVMGKSFGMPGNIDPENARDIERKIDLAKKGKKMFGDDSTPFDLKKAYQDANKGFLQTAVEAVAPKSLGGLLLTAASLGGYPFAKELSYGVTGYKAYKEGELIQDFDSLSDYLDFKERQRMTMSQAKAVGGAIRLMAGGGSVNSRDRVPALLEPGEFVIRRPMAKAIGGAALNQMNSTGRPPQISVNVNNSGMPKNVSVAPPKVNGDKIILDIITRDLRNNGGIKKALRRGK